MGKKKDKKRKKLDAEQLASVAAPPRPSIAVIMAKVGKIRLTAALLELAGTRFTETGDNPLDLRQFLPSVEDRRALMREYHDWNETPEIYNPEDEYPVVSDAAMMLWIADEMNDRVEAILAGVT